MAKPDQPFPVFLRELDAPRHLPHPVAPGPRLEELRHLERLGVMGNHALHEHHVPLGVPDAGEVGGIGGRYLPARLTGSARLHDRGLTGARRRGKRQERQTGGDARQVEEVRSGHGFISREADRANRFERPIVTPRSLPQVPAAPVSGSRNTWGG